MLNGLKIRQIAYYVNDIPKAIERHHAMFGSGPFFYAENMTFNVNYRGQDVEITHNAAFGQWGSMQVELLNTQMGGPSIFHELYPEGSGREGIHHVAVIADDLEATIAKAAEAGYPVVQDAYIPEMDLRIVMVDAVKDCGHFIEIYDNVPSVHHF